ncbi:MAG: hypothetical protein SFW36_01575 [Leptolyngbyaceae cyanobacterium bins.59]|nr:hypothetical protein [Leptolyngbyaceae cyanobacterium bins.59]
MTPEFWNQTSTPIRRSASTQSFVKGEVPSGPFVALEETCIRVRIPNCGDREKTLRRLVQDFGLVVTLHPLKLEASIEEQKAWLELELFGSPQQIRHALIDIDSE